MPKLNQIIAVEKGIRKRAEDVISELYRTIQKPALFAGLTREYKPKDDDGDRYPSESTLVQVKTDDVLNEFRAQFAKVADVVFTKESGNQTAKADVIVDGVPLLSDVPVTYLLFMEKWLNDIRVFITKVPELEADDKWSHDPTLGIYRNETQDTKKTKKVPRVLVKYEATDKHPAQTETWFEDVLEGYWSTTKLSGKMSPADKKVILDRVDRVINAVKAAREAANNAEVNNLKIAEGIFNYLLEG